MKKLILALSSFLFSAVTSALQDPELKAEAEKKITSSTRWVAKKCSVSPKKS